MPKKARASAGRKKTPPKPIDSVKHKDKRKNIPTEELKDFVKEDEQKPKTVKYKGLLYARDESLDPQLVWKGKDEQDREELTVPCVPIYIQEKIHPQAIIEDIREQAKKDRPERQIDLFSDFNGIPFEDLIEFYQHDANWANRMILGDSLAVMTSLAEKERLKGQVQMVYIDPPYGIKFASNWQVSTRKRNVTDGKAEDATRQPEQIRAFRDTWELGINSYLSYWRDRLVAVREVLSETGSVFIQINDENVHLVRNIGEEVFGSGNYVVTMIVKKKGATTPTDPVNDYLLWFAKDRSKLKVRRLFMERTEPEDDPKFNTLISSPGHHVRPGSHAEQVAALQLSGYNWARVNYPLVSQDPSDRSRDFVRHGKTYSCGKNRHWTFDPTEPMMRLGYAGRLFDGGGKSLGGVLFWKDWPYVAMSNLWDDLHGDQEVIYVVQTNRRIVERCLLMTTDPGDLVLDPTCGSGTTAYVAEKWGRRWITVDTSRVSLALARTRLMAGRFQYYLLSDSPEGVKKEAEITGRIPPPYKTGGDVRKGFVYERVPHIALKAIADNEQIDEIHEKWQPKQDAARKRLNKALKQKWQEWEVPFELEKDWPAEAKKLHKEWLKFRRDRQADIDASIARNAGQEFLYDKPYEDNKRVRVTGPFTVESLSPHRTISVEAKKQHADKGVEGWKVKELGPNQFGHIIIENLKKAGVQNTIKNERLNFDHLEPHAGTWIHATGEYTEKGKKKARRAAVCIGPEHGTVGSELIKEAAKEAVQGLGYDLLIVCGFAFDPSVNEEVKRYGKLAVLPTRINVDLQMGDEFLKKTGAANLFMVFGEPDLDVRKDDDGKLVVEIKGLDIYDPTTGQIRSNTTDDIACWFIDTNYNGESFFVRHAYFTGGDDPYDKLKRALKAEIDEAAWSSLYSTVSRPFDKPDTGKIAVKVINHYGDEVLKVYEV